MSALLFWKNIIFNRLLSNFSHKIKKKNSYIRNTPSNLCVIIFEKKTPPAVRKKYKGRYERRDNSHPKDK